MIFFAATAANMNDLVATEARLAGAEEVQLVSSGVEFTSDLASAYRFCLHSRIASRLLLGLAQDEGIYTSDDFYASSMQIPWEEYVNPEKTFSVTVTTIQCPWIKKSTYAAIRLKDAIVDRVKQHYDQERPSVEFDNPDVTFHLHIDRDEVSWYLDFSGRSLHQRGYRVDSTDAILKENLASAILMRSEWYKSITQESVAPLLDPFCGAGTIAVEAAFMATDKAPLLDNHEDFAFLKLDLHDQEIWEEVLKEAHDRHEKGKQKEVSITCWDIDPDAVELAHRHAIEAKVDHLITFEVKDFTQITKEDVPHTIGYVVTDPPYGIRMEESASLYKLYTSMGKQFNTLFEGWNVAILTGSSELLSFVDMKPERTNSFYNGPIEAQLAHYRVFTQQEKDERIQKKIREREERLSKPLSEGGQMVFNRLKKNLERLTPLMEKEGVSSYRLYDADMPEYAAAIDFYEGRYIHLQEYAPPSSIDPEDAQRRLDELIDATERVTLVDRDLIFVKQRREQKGLSQYEKLSDRGKFYIIREHDLMFSVNFSDYLDTGIFLDHRPVRKMIQEQANEKRFLNLFCYTGTATVHAAQGGALSTVSVDASATYLDWAMKNMEMNNFRTMNHFYYKDDAIQWLKNSNDTFDLIFCDPPTFSNSKMRETFDVYRDQRILIHLCMNRLSKGGKLIFSTNFRKFTLHPELEETYSIKEITDSTIGEDFKRNLKIHYCWEITHPKAIVKAPTKELTKKIVRRK
ncbi:MAG: bifunctional 23S rRNA (guanine(2069)-N(7))-methyltransferase RlmK/23S rRNA (guanine(2445)-N(2))-methyltransferase RlmL [Sphaerochaetaceae bacterium]